MAKTPKYEDEPEDAAPKAPSKDELKTEKEKAKADPIGKSVQPEKAQTMEELGIGASDPYPTGKKKDEEA